MTGKLMNHKWNVAILLALCALAYWWRLGKIGLIDPDEPFYTQTAREMVETGDWVTPQIFGKPQFEKPILHYWLMAAAYTTLGQTEFAARLPATLAATVLTLLTYWFASRLFNPRVGFFAALVLGTGGEYVLMSRLVLTDIPFTLFLCGSVFSLWCACRQDGRRDAWTIAYFVCSALAVLTKGPLGSIIPVLATVTFLWLAKRPHPFRGTGLWVGLALYAVIAVPWYAVMLAKYGWDYFNAFIVHDNIERFFRAEHPKFNHFWFYPALLVVGMIPWAPLVPAVLGRGWRGLRDNHPRLFLWCWLLTSLLFLTAAQSKLPSYGFPLFVPLAILMGVELDRLLARGFGGAVERTAAVTLALLQAIAIIGAATWQMFTPGAVIVGGLLVVSAVLLMWRPSVAWLSVSVAGILALVVLAMTVAAPRVEAAMSVQPLMATLLREHRPGEPVLTPKIQTRGVHFHSRLPVTVFASNPQPFFTPHPLPVVVGVEGLRQLLQTTPSALCVAGRKERRWLEDGFAERQRQVLAQSDDLTLIRVNAN